MSNGMKFLQSFMYDVKLFYLIRTPTSKINVPFMELQLNITNGMCQIETNFASLKK